MKGMVGVVNMDVWNGCPNDVKYVIKSATITLRNLMVYIKQKQSNASSLAQLLMAQGACGLGFVYLLFWNIMTGYAELSALCAFKIQVSSIFVFISSKWLFIPHFVFCCIGDKDYIDSGYHSLHSFTSVRGVVSSGKLRGPGAERTMNSDQRRNPSISPDP